MKRTDTGLTRERVEEMIGLTCLEDRPDQARALAALVVEACAALADSLEPKRYDTTTFEEAKAGKWSSTYGVGIRGACMVAQRLREMARESLP
jgi:hypothetical protein